MKLRVTLSGRKTLWFLPALLGVGLGSLAAAPPTPPKPNVPAPAVTNAAPAEPEIPKSVFVVPAAPADGRDPFFPQSMRPYGTVTLKTSKPAAPVVELQLKGISGPANNRLAIINNQSLKVGEEADVISATGRVHVHCVEIKAESVIVEIGGQRRELRLRAGL